jgi:type IV pilus assembly protein PilM
VGEVLRPEINALLQEINKTLVYMASRTRGKSVDKIYLAGRVCNYPGIVTNLGAQLHVPVEKLDPVAVFGAQNTRFASDLGTMAGMALTTGLALRGVREHE